MIFDKILNENKYLNWWNKRTVNQIIITGENFKFGLASSILKSKKAKQIAI